MKKKTQILFIHGGMTFKNDKDYLDFLKNRPLTLNREANWSGEYLEKNLGKNVEIIRPRMPLGENAKYRDWKIHFERYLKMLDGNIILIGWSLGGIFLTQYLSENSVSKKVLSTYCVAPPFDDTVSDEDLVGGFKLRSNLSKIHDNTENLHLLFSEDDYIVSLSHAEKYKQKIPDAHFVIYKSKNGHFFVKKFPELIKMIKKDLALNKA